MLEAMQSEVDERMCKKMSRLCSGILAVMLLLSACGADKGAGKKAEAVNPVAEYTSHSVSGTLHKVNVTPLCGKRQVRV